VAYDAFIVLKDEYYQELPQAVKDAITVASEEVKVKSREHWSSLQTEVLERAKAGGITITEPDTEALRQVATEIRASYPHVTPILDLVEASR